MFTAVAVVGALLVIAPSQASAHSSCIFKDTPGSVSDVACWFNNHYTVTVEDKYCGQDPTYIRFYVQGIAQSYVLTDTNGCAAGFAEWDLLAPVVRMTLCSPGYGCTGYVYT